MNKKSTKEYLASLGLFVITVWAAMQYVLLQYVPESVSPFAFLFVTNGVGLLILVLMRMPSLKKISKQTLGKGLILALELIGFNFFMILGSRGMDAVIISSLVSMYFAIVPIILLILHKRVSFRSAIASIVAIIALLLMFNADDTFFFNSSNAMFLLLADVFFAAYVVTVSERGQNEDAAALTISQLMFSVALSFLVWITEVFTGISEWSLPTDKMFWIAVVFFGIFIRALYGIIQIRCQKYVKPVNASMIFSMEIIITLIANPIIATLSHTDYQHANIYQIIGAILFVVAMMVADDTIMKKFGYFDMDIRTYTDKNGEKKEQTTLAKKLINMNLIISMSALMALAVICVISIGNIRKTAVNKSIELGQEAAYTSADALKGELEAELMTQVKGKAYLAEERLAVYAKSAKYAADYAEELYNHSSDYSEREVMFPLQKNSGIWAMQRILAEGVAYSSVEKENTLLGNMESVFNSITTNTDYITTIYIGTKTGLLISYDPNSEYANVGVENYYEYRDVEWYKKCAETSKVYFTSAYQDSYGRGLTITCAAPIIDENHEFRGCIGIDILMNDINESMVNDDIVDPVYATMIDLEGNIIAGREITATSSGSESIFNEKMELPIREVADEVFASDNGIAQSGEGDDAIFIAYSAIPHTEWKLCLISPVTNVIQPALDIKENINNNTEIVARTVNDTIRSVIYNCFVLFSILVLVITYFVGMLSNKITIPLRKLEKDVLQISQGHFDKRTSVATDDEIGSLARAFNFMTESLEQYIDDLTAVTTREERNKAELNVATKIQSDMLPKEFPAYPDRSDFDIFASMDPAKEVGGDFYDFFMLDEDHLVLTIADVSGKGVPGALFMMISMTLLKHQASVTRSPAEILQIVNNQLCANNEAEMFVTVWLGIVELSTGKVIAANAGHEFPALRKANGEFELFHDKHGFVLGGMEGVRYKEYEFEIEPGGVLFVYTDGVPEATSIENELFGTERMLQALNQHPNEKPEDLVAQVSSCITGFVKDAPQFDDITMLCFKRTE